MKHAWKSRPTDPKIEFALLLWWKIICIEMMGNDNWKHKRDYKAVIILLTKWLNHLPNEIIQKKLIEIEDNMAENDSIEWSLLEDVRVFTHDYLRDLENGKWNPATNMELSSFCLPEQWAFKRITEITNS